MRKRSRKVVFIVPYPLNDAASQRFRFEQYFEALNRNGIDFEVQSFFNSQNWRLFYSSGKKLLKSHLVLKGFLRRLTSLFRIAQFDFVFIHREATPIGPPVFEWILSKIVRSKIIYDFDDAIWTTDKTNESFILKFAKNRSKVALICKWAYKVSCGNHFLASFARQYNASVYYNPTTIDTENKHKRLIHTAKNDDVIVIGWTGSHSTLRYLEEVNIVLKTLLDANKTLRLHVIADRAPMLPYPFTFIPWSAETEIADLAQFDIGIMPLTDDEWSHGKCGFKALQYMSLEIPVVASAIGANRKIISSGVEGFLAEDMDSWYVGLLTLINNKELREKMGQNGRKKVVNEFSVKSNELNFLNLFQ